MNNQIDGTHMFKLVYVLKTMKKSLNLLNGNGNKFGGVHNRKMARVKLEKLQTLLHVDSLNSIIQQQEQQGS